MGIRYDSYEAGNHPNLVHARDRNLVMGWMLVSEDRENERLYAVHKDGRVRCTNWLKRPNDDFNHSARKWHDVGGPVPGGAEWIGHYEPDMF